MRKPPPTLVRYYTSHEIGAILGVTPSSVVKWINEGKLKAFTTPGGHRRVQAAELVRFSTEFNMPIPDELRGLAVSKVLLVDDEAPLLRAFRFAFKRHDDEFRLETAANGVDALMLIGSFHPDVLILDIQMPGLDGFDVLKRLKSSPATKDMAVIAISGGMNEPTKERCKKLGAAMCLMKPFDLDDLLKALRELRKPPTWSR